MRIWDDATRYGGVSRALHWSMAALMFWQFGGMLSKVALGREAGLTKILAGNHAQVGTILFLLIALRIVWAFLNHGNRPAHGGGLLARVARVGHAVLYGLMLLVPTAALLRAWGGEKPFAPFGFPVFGAREADQVVGVATRIGNDFHGELGWLMAALVVGHVVMAVAHHFVLRDGTMRRMA